MKRPATPSKATSARASRLAREFAVAKREQRMTAFHEAGHAALVRRFGGYGVAKVWRNSNANVRAGQRAWCGQFAMYARPGEVEFDDAARIALRVVEVPNRWQVLVGLAGLAAERIADDVIDPQEVAFAIEVAIFTGEVSSTDLDLIGTDWDVEDVSETLRYLLDTWREIEAHAAKMIVDF